MCTDRGKSAHKEAEMYNGMAYMNNWRFQYSESLRYMLGSGRRCNLKG